MIDTHTVDDIGALSIIFRRNELLLGRRPPRIATGAATTGYATQLTDTWVNVICISLHVYLVRSRWIFNISSSSFSAESYVCVYDTSGSVDH